jgi:hypothetical protein
MLAEPSHLEDVRGVGTGRNCSGAGGEELPHPVERRLGLQGRSRRDARRAGPVGRAGICVWPVRRRCRTVPPHVVCRASVGRAVVRHGAGGRAGWLTVAPRAPTTASCCGRCAAHRRLQTPAGPSCTRHAPTRTHARVRCA